MLMKNNISQLKSPLLIEVLQRMLQWQINKAWILYSLGTVSHITVGFPYISLFVLNLSKSEKANLHLKIFFVQDSFIIED